MFTVLTLAEVRPLQDIGIEASRKIRELVKYHEVSYENRGYDSCGRMIGLCHADGVDFQAAMCARAWLGRLRITAPGGSTGHD